MTQTGSDEFTERSIGERGPAPVPVPPDISGGGERREVVSNRRNFGTLGLMWAVATGWAALPLFAPSLRLLVPYQELSGGSAALVAFYIGLGACAIAIITGLWAQYSVLQRATSAFGRQLSVSRARWLALSGAAWLVAAVLMLWGLRQATDFVARWLAQQGVSVPDGLFDRAIWTGVAPAILVGTLAGVIIGSAQRALLSKDLPQSRWVLSSWLGWALAVVTYVLLIYPVSWMVMWFGDPLITFGALVVASLPSLVMIALSCTRPLSSGLLAGAAPAFLPGEAISGPESLSASAHVERARHPKKSATPLLSVWLGVAAVVLVIVAWQAVPLVGYLGASLQVSGHAVRPYHTIQLSEEHGYDGAQFAYSPDGTLLALASGKGHRDFDTDEYWAEGQIQVLRAADKAVLYTLSFGPSPKGEWGDYPDHPSVSFSTDGQTLVTGFGPALEFRRAADGAVVRTLTGANIGNYTRFSPDRQHFISYNGLEPFSLWRTSDGQRIPLKTMPFRGGDRGVFFPDNQTVAVVWPELVAIWSLDDGSELPRVALPAGSPLSKSPVFAIAADGKKAANLRYGDEKSELFSLPEGELIRTFDLEEASAGLFPNPGRPQFSPDGSLLAVSTGSDSVMLWRVEDGGLVAHLTSGGDKRYPDAGFSAMAFSPDGKEFVGRSQAGAIRFWKLP